MAGSFWRATRFIPEGFGNRSTGDGELWNISQTIPEENAGFPERFPKSSRTKGCFSRTTPEHVPKKPAKNVEEIGDKRRISVGDQQAEGGYRPGLVFHLSSTCLPFVSEQA